MLWYNFLINVVLIWENTFLQLFMLLVRCYGIDIKATEVCGYKTKSATRKIIAELLKKKLIEKQGSGPATRYVLTKEYFNDLKRNDKSL